MPKKIGSTEGFLWVGAYVLIRMVLDPWFWRSLPQEWSLGFEALFVLAAGLRFRPRLRSRLTAAHLRWALAALGAGFVAHQAGILLGLRIPFDFRDPTTLVLLLAIGPVLEEALFRMALWEALEAGWRKPIATWALTTVLFALGHLAAWAFVPAEYRSFVIYQTAYVLALGAWTGWARLKSLSLWPAVGMHLGFNLGFYWASW